MAHGTKFRFVDLFAGLGGFHVALESLGGEAVFASEWVGSLQDLYTKNFGLRPAGDIRAVDPASIPNHDVLCAGFPCQPFSKAGEQLGFEHTEQGRLFFEVAAILQAKRPEYVILENVPNLARHRGGESLARIVSELELLGYEVQSGKFSPHEFGVPQIRERLYIVGSLSGLAEFQWPATSSEPTNIRSVLDVDPDDARSLTPALLNTLNVWQAFLDASPDDLEMPSWPIWSMEFGADYPFEAETPHSLMSDFGAFGLSRHRGSHGIPLDSASIDKQLQLLPSHAQRQQREFPRWKRKFISQNRSFYAEHNRWIDPWMHRVRDLPSSHQKFEWNVKGEDKDVFGFVIQVRASGIRVKRPTTAPSLVAMTDTQVPIIGWERRYMTPRECSRLQSLGNIELPASRIDAHKALGNAVNAQVVRAIAGALLSSGRVASLPNSGTDLRVSSRQDLRVRVS